MLPALRIAEDQNEILYGSTAAFEWLGLWATVPSLVAENPHRAAKRPGPRRSLQRRCERPASLRGRRCQPYPRGDRSAIRPARADALGSGGTAGSVLRRL